jgi:hypothetical protein
MGTSKADEYRQRAEEAEEWANNTGDVEDRKKFENIARQWRELIERAAAKGGLTIDVLVKPDDETSH